MKKAMLTSLLFYSLVIYSQEAQIQEGLDYLFSHSPYSQLSQNTFDLQCTVDLFTAILKNLNDYKLADTLFSKNKVNLERYLSHPHIQARTRFYFSNGYLDGSGNGVAMLLVSYYQDKIAEIMNPDFRGDKLQALKDLCNDTSEDVRLAIYYSLERFNSTPLIQQFKQYLNDPHNFQTEWTYWTNKISS